MQQGFNKSRKTEHAAHGDNNETTQQSSNKLMHMEWAAQEEEDQIWHLNPSIWLPDHYQLCVEEVREIIQILNGLSCALGSQTLFIDDVSDL